MVNPCTRSFSAALLLGFCLLPCAIPREGATAEITEIHLDLAPISTPSVVVLPEIKERRPRDHSTHYSPKLSISSPSATHGAVAFRWSRSASKNDGIFPILVDLHDLADEQLEEKFIKQTREESLKFEGCVTDALGRQEPTAKRAVIHVVLEKNGIARVTSLRMEGPHSTAFQDCFWRVVRGWKFYDLPPIDHKKVFHLAIENNRLPSQEKTTDSTQPMDRSKGLVTLLGAEGDFPSGGDLWAETLASWVGDLSQCFENSWVHSGYVCEGPILLPLVVSGAGEIIHTEMPSFYDNDPTFYESAPILEEDAKIPDITPPLTPECSPEVATCLQNSVSIWLLPNVENTIETDTPLTLHLMVDPPGRLEERTPPSAWTSSEKAKPTETTPKNIWE